MSGEKVVRYKLHFVWQDDREERWLRDMARQGLHLVSANALCRYVFRRGEPADIAYRLDFSRGRRDPGYYQLFEDAGWEHVLSCMGWKYWRKRADGTEPEIFTDGASKAARLRRVRNGFVAVGVPSLAAAANPIYLHTSQASDGSRIGLVAVVATLAALYVYGFVKITQRIRAVRSPV